MKCKKHLSTDLSSIAGVCATCLRERLLVLIAAQTQLDLAAASTAENPRKPPLTFPRSVSPYVSRRKSDHRIFYSTSLVDLRATTTSDCDAAVTYSKKKHRFSIFSNMFATRSDKFNSNPRVHHHRDSCGEESSSSSSTPSWLSSVFTVGRKSQQSLQFGPRDRRPCVNRGMSPADETNSRDECDRTPPETSPEVSPQWAPGRRVRTGRKNMSGMAFCLSPLVRASPNWKQKSGFPPGKGRPPQTKTQLGGAAGFRANRSKKISDFGPVKYYNR